MIEPKRVWYNWKLVYSNKQNVWYVDDELKTYGQKGYADAGELEYYDNKGWHSVPADWELEYYNSFDWSYVGTSEDWLEATATFKNWDETLQTVKVKDWQTPKYTGGTPTKAADSENTYEFDGWKPQVKAISKDTTYVAQFKAVPIPPTPAES